MTFVEELANEIWGAPAFHSDFAHLEAENIRAEIQLSLASSIATDVKQDLMLRLAQTALIFGACDADHFREAAQRISTALVRSLGQDADTLFAMIQCRLQNFPMIASKLGSLAAPKQAPLSLQFEYVNERSHNTIQSADGQDHALTRFQLASWRTLERGRSTTLTGPTSAGKSYILLLYIIDCLQTSGASCVAYLVPTRALINQVTEDAIKELERRGLTDITTTSLPVDITSSRAHRTLYVLTQERLEALLVNYPEVRFDLIIVDEAQILGDGARGVLLESVLDRLKPAAASTQFVFSGPMIENPEYFGTIFTFKDFEPCSTTQSPVTQNVIYLNYREQPQPVVEVQANAQSDVVVTTIELEHRLLTDVDKLSHLSVVFGRGGSNIVYAGGKADAEKIALKIAQECAPLPPETVGELIAFVKRHIHKDYALVTTLSKGIAFHYGHMPSLLRKELEDHFRERVLKTMVCTSTLLYGLNLPARSIFLLKPTTGRGTAISGPDFWNLAGRAGRLGKELEGNVYLIDYDRWDSKPVTESKNTVVDSALRTSMSDRGESLAKYLADQTVSSEAEPELEITLGKLILDERGGLLGQTVERYRNEANSTLLDEIGEKVTAISAEIELPNEILNKNIGVSVFRQRDLLRYFERRLKQLPPEEIIPAHPLAEFELALPSYQRAFKRIHTYLLRYPGRDRRQFFFAGLALRWMRGDPLPVLISSAIRYHENNKTGKSTASIIRETLENVEDDLRFRYVKFFTCYNSVLTYALERTGNVKYVDNIPNIPLFLEMGGSSGVMINLMALGLSRTTAESISEYITDKEMELEPLRTWLKSHDFSRYDVSPACIREVEMLVKKL